ncbi:MAG: hypothetical protein RLY57_751 [Candidatus Parcubacteria bacterium]
MSKILLRITFIIALIIAIALIALVIVRYSPRFFSYVSSASASLFNVFKKESLEVSVSPQTAVSGEKVVLTWSTNSQESVSLTYPCNNEYALSYLGGSATKMPIRCGEAFELGGTTGTATVIPTLASSNNFSDIEITVAQTRADNKKASGVGVITVTSGSAAVSPSATSTKPSLTTTPSSGQTSTTKKPSTTQLPKTIPTVSGPANLTLSEPQYVYGLGPAVQFTVTNNGGSNSGLWELRAILPNGDTFNSGILAGIPAGGSTLFTLNLGTIQKGSNTVKVTVDVNNAVTESNENDNMKSATFNSSTGNTTTTTSGKADLTVKVLSIGYIKGDTIGIRFEIRNNGGTTAENWRFEADLPTEDDEEYRSSSQPDLKPGEAMEYTLGFDNAVSNGYATIRVDSDNDVKESDEDNNKLRFRVTN